MTNVFQETVVLKMKRGRGRDRGRGSSKQSGEAASSQYRGRGPRRGAQIKGGRGRGQGVEGEVNFSQSYGDSTGGRNRHDSDRNTRSSSRSGGRNRGYTRRNAGSGTLEVSIDTLTSIHGVTIMLKVS